MKAILFQEYGSFDHLKQTEIPTPTPAPNEVLIRVKSNSLNAMEWHLFRGMWLVRGKIGLFKPKQKYNVLGADVSGEVIAIGDKVTRFKKGDTVFGDIFTGGFAEYALAKPDQLNIKPENISFEDAATLPVAGMTALKSVKEICQIKKGDQVLINGASGGVGSFAIQLARHYGAHVTAVCSKKNADFVTQLGANAVIDYNQTDFTRAGIQYDHILDVVGNKKNRELKKALKPNGKCAIIGFSSFKLLLSAMLSFSKQINVVSVKVSPEILEELGTLMSKGHLKSIITETYSLDQLPQALKHQSTRHVHGKQVIIH